YEELPKSVIPHRHASFFTRIFKTDIIEKDEQYEVHLDIPGIRKGDLEVFVQQDKALFVKAVRNKTHADDADAVHALERVFGLVQRKIPLPQTADIDKASSSVKNGVLTVKMPKLSSVPASSRKLPVKEE
ncbi:HSP20-like chaperone, partial [Ochromonadaceae sp. CCMP2298]